MYTFKFHMDIKCTRILWRKKDFQHGLFKNKATSSKFYKEGGKTGLRMHQGRQPQIGQIQSMHRFTDSYIGICIYLIPKHLTFGLYYPNMYHLASLIKFQSPKCSSCCILHLSHLNPCIL